MVTAYLYLEQFMKEGLKREYRQQRDIVFGRRRYWFHIAIWACVVLFAVAAKSDFMKGMSDGLVKVQSDTAGINLMLLICSGIIGALLAAVMVYVFLLLVIPYARYKRRKRYLWLGIFLNGAVWILILIIAGFTAGYVADSRHSSTSAIYGMSVGIIASISVVITGYFFSLYYFLDLYDQQKDLNRYQQVFTDKMHAETNFLKTQINPHFLFNTLNNIYSLTLKKSDDARVITSRLKDLIQYMLTDCSKEMVSLSGELLFLKNYIALEELRNKQEQVAISLEVSGDPGDRVIAPLLLINFIENAFKHGVKAGIEHAFVKINLYIMDNVFAMDIVNSKPDIRSAKDMSVKQDGGIGIRNVKRRLELLYPRKHKLRVRQSAKEFRVYLNIDLS